MVIVMTPAAGDTDIDTVVAHIEAHGGQAFVSKGVTRTIVGVVSIGYAVPGPRSPSLRRHRRSGREVAHWGRFGVAGESG